MPLKPHHRPKRNKPSLIRQAVSFTAAAAKHVASGMKRRPPEEYDRVLAICQACPELDENGRCNVCGCFVKIKAAWATQHCPLEKW